MKSKQLRELRFALISSIVCLVMSISCLVGMSLAVFRVEVNRGDNHISAGVWETNDNTPPLTNAPMMQSPNPIEETSTDLPNKSQDNEQNLIERPQESEEPVVEEEKIQEEAQEESQKEAEEKLEDNTEEVVAEPEVATEN